MFRLAFVQAPAALGLRFVSHRWAACAVGPFIGVGVCVTWCVSVGTILGVGVCGMFGVGVCTALGVAVAVIAAVRRYPYRTHP